jgi:protein dithiol oxidoreductase (disulfide-forming)
MRAISLAFISLWFIASIALASPTSPVEGAEYRTLGTPQAVTSTGKKVEVVEFFMYHCPACNALEPQLLAWVKKQGDNIEFRRIHLPHTGNKDPETHLFLTLEALNVEKELHAKILNTWHVEHHQLLTDNDNIEWAVKNGFDKAKFMETYFSFSVMSKLQGAQRIGESYQVNSTPTLVIDGRYITDPGLIQNSNPTIPGEGLDQATLQVADVLVQKAKAGK